LGAKNKTNKSSTRTGNCECSVHSERISITLSTLPKSQLEALPQKAIFTTA